MSEVFHGVVFRCAEHKVRSVFSAIKSGILLRLVQFDDDIFGIYASRYFPNAVDLDRASKQLVRMPGELQRIASQLSRSVGSALFYFYDSRVDSWYQLYEDGEMTRELELGRRSDKSWGKGHPLESVGALPSLLDKVASAFQYDDLEPLAENAPTYGKRAPE